MMLELIPYYIVAVVAAPLTAAVLNAIIFGYANRTSNVRIQYWTIAISIVSVLVALSAHFALINVHPTLSGEGTATIINPASWMRLNYPLRLDWAVRYDGLTTIMVPVVLFVGLMVQIFSVGYLHDRQKDYARYFAWLSFFMFSMLLLVQAANLFVFFVGWEAVGLSSYKLISFYIEKEAAQRAGKKAFIINRIGDAALLIGCFAIFRLANTADFREITLAFAKGSIATAHANFICIMIFLGAAAKSAQLPLYTWLPDAMTGPTPVSALIHAATMVTAGIFLMLRLEPIFVVAPEASLVVAYVGALTSLVAAYIAVCQTDIKKILAFSTVSQLGLMVLALGSGAYAAAFFHLFTHAFFKAMLFLAAGAVITYMHHEQNIRKMGGIGRQRPLLAALFWIALVALSGIPGLSGFFSKDHVLAAAFSVQSHGVLLGTMASVASLLTAFYSFRLGIIVFHGPNGAHSAASSHAEPTVSFYLPLTILAVPTIFAGWFGIPSIFTGHEPAFLEFVSRNLPAVVYGASLSTAGAEMHAAELRLVMLSVGIALSGAIVAFVYYGLLRRRPVAEGAYRNAFSRLSLRKLYLDEIYDAIFVVPYRKIADTISKWDFRMLPTISDGIGAFVQTVAGFFARLQDGVISNYAIFMLAGLVALLLIALGSV
jgi:NADH-quinone oxidoreductase subunit L